MSEVATAAKEEYESYIAMVEETLGLFAAFPATAFGSIDMRSLAVNLCRFQDRWAAPLELPFGMGYAYEETLATPRPEEWLRRIGAVVEASGGALHYAGSEEWKKATAAETEASGGDPSSSSSSSSSASPSVEPEISFAKWMKELHLALVCCSEQGEEHESQARALCGCWYYHASETCFVEGEEAPDAEGEADDSSQEDAAGSVSKRRRTPLGSVAQDEEMGEDEDEEDDDEYEPSGDEEDNDDDDDDEEEDEEEEEENVEDEQESIAGSKRAAGEEGAPDAKKSKPSGGEYEEELKGEAQEGGAS
jgi:hypothetical protein